MDTAKNSSKELVDASVCSNTLLEDKNKSKIYILDDIIIPPSIDNNLGEYFLVNFKDSLQSLKINDKKVIEDLTEAAAIGYKNASQIVDIIINDGMCEGILKLYLVDSIIKNVGGQYVDLFSNGIANIFVHLFKFGDSLCRRKLFSLRCTWNGVVNASTLQLLDNTIHQIDKNWPTQFIQKPSLDEVKSGIERGTSSNSISMEEILADFDLTKGDMSGVLSQSSNRSGPNILCSRNANKENVIVREPSMKRKIQNLSDDINSEPALVNDSARKSSRKDSTLRDSAARKSTVGQSNSSRVKTLVKPNSVNDKHNASQLEMKSNQGDPARKSTRKDSTLSDSAARKSTVGQSNSSRVKTLVKPNSVNDKHNAGQLELRSNQSVIPKNQEKSSQSSSSSATCLIPNNLCVDGESNTHERGKENDNDDSIPQYSSPETSLVTVPERKTRSDKRWKKEATFNCEQEALEVLKKENCWSKQTTNKSYDGDSVLYRCNKVKAKTLQCNSGVYLFYHADSAKVSLFRSGNQHDCEELIPRGKLALSEEQKSAIIKLLKERAKRKEIMNELYLNDIPVPTKNQLNNFIVAWNRENNGPPVISVCELLTLLRARVAVPDDSDDEAFVVAHRILDEDEDDDITFDFLVSSKKLLKNAIGKNLIACDATNKILWQGFPVIPIGTMDADRHFHLIAVGVSTNEKTENFQYYFESLKTSIKDIFQVCIEPKILITDAAKAIQNSFMTVFGDDCLILMCWFHMKKAFIKKIASLLPKKVHAEVISDIDKLQLSRDPAMFETASRLFLEKYAAYDDFIEYFEFEWLKQNRNWYEGAAPNLVPSTNNAEETWNRLLKDEKTLRRRLPLPEFIKNIHDWVESWSVEYDSGAKCNFINEPTIDLQLWTKSYQWVRLKRPLKKKPSNPNIIVVPSSEAIAAGQNCNSVINTVEWDTFKDFRDTAFASWEVDISDGDWTKWFCTCPSFQKCYMCKHVVGIALRMKMAFAPDEAKTVPIALKKVKYGQYFGCV